MKDNIKIKIYLRFYHILFLSILFSIFLIKNSFIQKNKRKPEQNQIKNIEIKNREIPFLRQLNFYDDSIKVCKRSSENLKKYFETGDTKYVKLYELSEQEKPPNYILSLIDLLSNEGNSEENFNNYMRHLLPTIFFFVVTVAAIPGWITCCSCSCYNCYCCSCCKKPECRKPFFIIVSLMNILIIILCILGLLKTNDIFTGLTNTECSILRFINEVLEGETKSTLPKWGGIASIISMFENTVIEIEKMASNNVESETRDKMNDYKTAIDNFKTSLKNACNDINSEGNYIYNDYIFDLAKKFGKYENDDFSEDSYASNWMKEAYFTDSVEKSYNVLGDIIVSNVGIGMRNAEEFINDMKEGIEGIKDMIGEKILKYSETIDNTGKLIFKLVFLILLLFSFLLEILLIFLYVFSSRKCIGNFCCANFLVKILIHILWNIFALIMIAIFLFGTIMTLVGSFGEDLFQVFSFLISKQNLQSNSPKVLGDGGPILDVCMNGNGVITNLLGIDSDLGNIDILKTLTQKTDSIFEKIISNEAEANKDLVYDALIAEINKKKQDNDFDFVGNILSNIQEKINLKETISNLNSNLETCEIKERWSFLCSSEFSDFVNDDTCYNTISETNICMNPSICYDEINNRYSSCEGTNELTNIINKIILAINYMDNNGNGNSISLKANNAKGAYRQFLTEAKNALNGYTAKFKPVTAIYDNFVGNGSILGFLNCAFLGKNLKVLLKYLNDSVGEQFKNLGFIILSTGIEMALSISFTIILIIIFNATIQIREDDQRKPIFNQDQVPPIQSYPLTLQNNNINSKNEFDEK